MVSLPVAAGPFSQPVENVSVTFTANPALDFQVNPNSIGPVTIQPGTTHEFLISYTIGPNATAGGPYTVTLHQQSSNPDAYRDPDDPAGDEVVSFTIATPPAVRVLEPDLDELSAGATTHWTSVSVLALSELGVSTIVLSGLDSNYREERAPGEAGYVDFPLGGGALANGSYKVEVHDTAGHIGATGFYVDKDTVAPAALIFDHDPLALDPKGSFVGDNFSSVQPLWLRNSVTDPSASISFEMVDDGTGLSTFRLGYDDLRTLAVIDPFSAKTISFAASAGLLPEGTGYLLSAKDQFQQETKVFFGVDSAAPSISSAAFLVEEDLSISLRAAYVDAVSGVANIALIAQGGPLTLPGQPGLGPRERVETLPLPLGGGGHILSFWGASDASGLTNAMNYVDVGLVSGGDNFAFLLGDSSVRDRWVYMPSGNLGSRLRSMAVSADSCQLRPAAGCAGMGCVVPQETICGWATLKVRTRTPGQVGDLSLYTVGVGTAPIELVYQRVPLTLAGGARFDKDLSLGTSIEFLLEVEDAGHPLYAPGGALYYAMDGLYGIGVLGFVTQPLVSGLNISAVMNGITLTFNSVSPGPDNRIGVNAVPAPPPSGLSYLPGAPNLVQDVVTTADYGGPLQVEMPYPAGSLSVGQQAQIKLMHKEDGVWVDRTTGVDMARGVVKGQVPHASYFGVFIPTAALQLGGPAPQAGRGLAIGGDTQGRLWEVVASTDPVIQGAWLSAFDSAGVFQSSTALPGAVSDAAWSVRFAPGAAYAVGAASGPATRGVDAAIYKVSQDGTLLKQTFFDAGLGGDDFAFDSAGDLWVTGALSNEAEGYSLGLWKYSMQDDTLVLKSSYSAGTGLDAGFGVALDAAQNIWVVGFSSNDYTQNPNKLDLALWKFDPAGTRLLDGPFLQPGYAQGLDSVFSAKIAAHAGQLVVAAARRNTLGNSDLATLRFDLDGELISQRFWHGAPGADDVPRAMGFDGQGGLIITGESTADPQHPALAFWPVDAAGRIFNAQTASGVGPARGIAIQGQDTWLAVGSSAPYRFLGGIPLAGSAGAEGPADFTPPFTQLVVLGTSAVSEGIVTAVEGSTFALMAQDPVVDGYASGFSDTIYVIDVDPSCENPGESAAPGTCRNPIYAGPFLLAVGTHTVYYLSSDLAGNDEDLRVSSITVVSAVSDNIPPVTAFVIGEPRLSTGTVFIASTTPLDFTVSEPAQTAYAIDGGTFSVYAGTFTLALEGVRSVAFYSVDLAGNIEAVRVSSVTVDATAPLTAFEMAGATASLSAQDSGSGVGSILYSIGEAASYPQGFLIYSAPFFLAPGTHTVYFAATDNVGNAELLTSSAVSVAVAAAPLALLNPTTGPIGIPFTLTGTPFGAFNGTSTRVKFGAASAPISVWNNTTISGTVPGSGLLPGTYPVVIERQTGAVVVSSSAGTFTVTRPTALVINPSTGPIGIPVTLTGTSFGPFNGANTRLRVGGSTSPVSVWNDTTISITLPRLSTGTKTLFIERATADGGLLTSVTYFFTVTAPQINTMTPSSGPIGIPITLTGTSFGPFNGANTRLRVGGSTAPISVWNDTTISATIPGVAPGPQPLVLERATADGGLMTSEVLTFNVNLPTPSSITPSSGPIGIAVTVNGVGFGPFSGVNTRLLIGGATAAISVWNDTKIVATVPGILTPGPKSVVVLRLTSGGGVAESAPLSFQVAGLFIAAFSPSTGPIGIPFTLNGTDFGTYNGVNTRVKFGEALAPISVWNDTTIQGTVPGVAAGTYTVTVERQSGANVSAAAAAFTVLLPQAQAIAPSTGPIGIALTVTGTAFGSFAGTYTNLLIGGTTAPISVWNDATIVATVPGSLTPGVKEVIVRRQTADGGVADSAPLSFEATALAIGSLNPSTGPIGIPFSITGSGFGPFNGTNTRVKFGLIPAPISVWNDSTIAGTVPGLAPGDYAVVIEREQAGQVSASLASTFTVVLPQVFTLTPSSAPIGAPFTLTGAGFGPFAGTYTQVLIGGLAAPVSVWNDATISGTVPAALSAGDMSLVVRRTTSGGGLAESPEQAFAVVVPFIEALSPAMGQAGTAFELTGRGFGPYAGTQTRVLVGGLSASLSIWNDVLIRGIIPDALSNGTYTIVAQRLPPGGGVESNEVAFTVGTPPNQGVLGLSGISPASRTIVHPGWYYEAGLKLPSAEGGKVEAPSRASVVVPANSLDQDLDISILRGRKGTADQQARDGAQTAGRLGSVGEAVEFGPEGARFTVPVTIELPYDPGAVPPGKEREVAVHYWDPAAKTWLALPSELDLLRKRVRARTDHFSLYQPLVPGVLAAAPAAGGTAFGYVDVYAFPNPARGGQQPVVRVQVGVADVVEVRYYDVSGRLVRSASLTSPKAVDDGNGKGNQWTYDDTWDTGGVASGVYVYAVTAKKGGFGDIRKTGRVAVIK